MAFLGLLQPYGCGIFTAQPCPNGPALPAGLGHSALLPANISYFHILTFIAAPRIQNLLPIK